MPDDDDAIAELVYSGQYASKGVARRELGIMADALPMPLSGWLAGIAGGLAGAHPKSPNA